MRKSELKTRLARARVVAGLTQVDFSKISEISIDQIRHFERAGRPMTTLHIVKFAQVLGVSDAWLAGSGQENEPIALDGEPYTREKYLEHKASGLQRSWSWKRDKMDDATRALLEERAQAWKTYLDCVLASVFSREIHHVYPLDRDLLALKILTIIQDHVHGGGKLLQPKDSSMPLPECTVDEILRDLRADSKKA